jgi:hypothetical protein
MGFDFLGRGDRRGGIGIWGHSGYCILDCPGIVRSFPDFGSDRFLAAEHLSKIEHD